MRGLHSPLPVDDHHGSAVTSEKDTWMPEHRDVPIDVAEVERLLAPWSTERSVISAAFLAGGLMNRNYRVRFDGGDDVVLRFYDRDAHSCAKEVSLLRELRGQIPVPEVLHVDESAGGIPFVVMNVVEGVSLRQLKKTGSAEAIAQAAYDAGRQLARLASIVPKQPANVTPDLDPELLRGSNVNARVIDHFCESPCLREGLRERDVTRVHDFAWQRDERLSTWPANRIAHGDFNASNIFVYQRNGEWIVSGILDWEFAFPGSSCYDIGNFLRYERADRPCYEPHFSRGLVNGGVQLPNDWRTTARLADLGALCELLTRPTLPTNVVEEVCDLIRATLDESEIVSAS